MHGPHENGKIELQSHGEPERGSPPLTRCAGSRERKVGIFNYLLPFFKLNIVDSIPIARCSKVGSASIARDARTEPSRLDLGNRCSQATALGRVGPGQQVVDLALRMTGDYAGDVGEVGLRVDGVELAGLYQRGDDGPVLAAAVGAGEESVLAIERDRPDGALDHVGVDLAGRRGGSG